VTSRILVSLKIKAAPAVVFEAFVNDIGLWWQPNPMFAFTPRAPGVLRFEPGPDGRLIETRAGGKQFEVGKIRLWSPPDRLIFSWKQATFQNGMDTQVEVTFESISAGTRVTVQHWAWDTVPLDHVARHGMPDAVFQRRHGEWWRQVLERLQGHIS